MRNINYSSCMGRIASIIKANPWSNYVFIRSEAERIYGYKPSYVSNAINNLFKRGNLVRKGGVKKYIYFFIEVEKCGLDFKREHVTPEYLLENFKYYSDTGKIIWIKNRYKNKIGADACSYVSEYKRIIIHGKTFLAHRVAWAMFTGSWPDNLIDHINGIKSDNRICNLRQATYEQNNSNVKSPVKSKTGFRGVTYSKSKNKYLARIRVKRKLVDLGAFDDPIEAYECYKKEAKRIKGEFYREPTE